MAKHWYMEFEPTKWLGDHCLRQCAGATRGYWVDWLCAMFQDDRSGQIVATVQRLAGIANCTPREAAVALAELKDTKAAEVGGLSPIQASKPEHVVTLTNRKMRREFITRKLAYARKLRQRGDPVPEWVTLLSRESHASYGVDDEDLDVSGKGDARGETGFSEFWSRWPSGGRKAARQQCADKWDARKLDAIADQVLAGLDRWLASAEWAKDGGSYIPAPLVWLNQSRWEAEPEPAKRRQQTAAEIAAEVHAYEERMKR